MNFKSRIFIIVSEVLFFPIFTFSQPDPSQAKTRKIHLSNADSAITSEVLIKPKKLCLKADRDYYWFYSGKIMSTQGNYSGDLLDGIYQAFYPNKNLCVSGHFCSGLKTGVWEHWYDNGKLQQSEHYRKGRIVGTQCFYDEKGNKIKSVKYRFGKAVLNDKNATKQNKNKQYQWHIFNIRPRSMAALYF